MEPNDYIDQEVAETLKALDDLEPASAPPFFASRVIARLDQSSQPRAFSRIWRISPAIQVALFGMLIMLNVAILWTNVQSGSNEISRTEQLEAFATEYSLQAKGLETLLLE